MHGSDASVSFLFLFLALLWFAGCWSPKINAGVPSTVFFGFCEIKNEQHESRTRRPPFLPLSFTTWRGTDTIYSTYSSQEEEKKGSREAANELLVVVGDTVLLLFWPSGRHERAQLL
jgi:hypothetical protein